MLPKAKTDITHLFRYEYEVNSPFEPIVTLLQFRVLRTTPHGYWVKLDRKDVSSSISNAKWLFRFAEKESLVLTAEGNCKRLAYDSLLDAQISLKHRLRKRISRTQNLLNQLRTVYEHQYLPTPGRDTHGPYTYIQVKAPFYVS